MRFLLILIIFINFSYGQNSLYQIVVSEITPSLINSDHTSEGFLVTLNSGRVVHFFRLDPGFEGHHIGNKGKIVKRYSDDGGASWSAISVVYADSLDDRNINGGIVGNDRIVMTFRRYDADSLKHVDFNLIYSDDGGETWSPRQILNTNGVCGDTHTLISVPGKGYMNVFSNVNYIEIRYSHDGIDWSNLAYAWDYSLSLEYKINESCFAYTKDGKMVGLMRNETYTLGGNYYQVVSGDSGTTWTNPISTNIADSFFCPSPKIFYDERHDDLWTIATDRRGGNLLNSNNVNSEIWLYSNKVEDIFSNPRNWSLKKKMKRPLPSIYRLYGYAIYTKLKNGNYLVVFSEGSRKINNKEDADFYQFEIKYIDTSNPMLTNISICYNDLTPDITTSGFNVKWFKDSTFTDLIGFGNTFKPSIHNIGSYKFYATSIDPVTGYESLVNIVQYTINASPEMPTVSNTAICFGEDIPELNASGENIKWFADSDLDTLLFEGNIFKSSETEPGTYNYYITQFVNNCYSMPATSTYTIYPTPEAPLSSNASVCYGEAVPELIAFGTNVQWYNDSALMNLLHVGNNYIPSENQTGSYSYYIIQKDDNCFSETASAIFSIMPKPEIVLNIIEATINSGESVQIEALNPLQYSWYPPEGLSSANGQIITASPLSTQTYTVTGIDENGCTNTAIIKINVDSIVGITENYFKNTLSVYPNPSTGIFTVGSISINSKEVKLISIIDSQGKVVTMKMPKLESDNKLSHEFNLNGISKGIYYIIVQTETDIFAKPIEILDSF